MKYGKIIEKEDIPTELVDMNVISYVSIVRYLSFTFRELVLEAAKYYGDHENEQFDGGTRPGEDYLIRWLAIKIKSAVSALKVLYEKSNTVNKEVETLIEEVTKEFDITFDE